MTKPTKLEDREQAARRKAEFWEWVREEQHRLERKIEELSDPGEPDRRARDMFKEFRPRIAAEWGRELGRSLGLDVTNADDLEELIRRVQPPSRETFDDQVLKNLRAWATQEVERELANARQELDQFLDGPILWSEKNRPRYRRGVRDFKRSQPRLGLPEEYKKRFRGALTVIAVEALRDFRDTPADQPPEIPPEEIPIYVEPTQRGLMRLRAIEALIMFQLSERIHVEGSAEVTEEEVREASKWAWQVLRANEDTDPAKYLRRRDWARSTVWAMNVVANVIDLPFETVKNTYEVWHTLPR